MVETSIFNIPVEHLTPGMKQYLEAKRAHPDCLIMLRMGDFYEMFYEDAITSSRELEITLTSRGKDEKKAPLAGVPFHALEAYLGRLIKKGYKVAIIEQLEDPKQAKGLVKRGLVRIVTPGTIIESALLNEKENNYIMSLTAYADQYAAAFCDLSTGEFFALQVPSLTNLLNLLVRFNPSEGVIPESLNVNIEVIEKIKSFGCFLNSVDDYFFKPEKARETICKHFNAASLHQFGLEEEKQLVSVAGALLKYLHDTQKNSLTHLQNISIRSNDTLMLLDSSTIRNLELLKNIRDGSSRRTLLSVLDKTVTALGARLLKKWIKEPLLVKEVIHQRLNAVEALHKNIIAREEIISLLQETYDLERLISRVNYGNANPRDLLALCKSLYQIPLLKEKLKPLPSNLLHQIAAMKDSQEIAFLIKKSIKEDAPITIREGGIIKPGFSQELDALHDIKNNSKKYLQQLEEREKAKTSISTLKIGYTNVFGYFIEVTKKNIHLVPETYSRKQTTANSERYITEELKIIEEKILGAEEKINELEYYLFQEIMKKTAEHTADIQDAAQKVAVLDVLCSLAKVAAENNYTRPELVDKKVLHIKNGRHPVVEQLEKSFIANDVLLKEGEMMILTGPNMAGKCLIGESIVYSDKGMIPIKHLQPAKMNAETFHPLIINICGKDGSEKTSQFYYDGKKSTIKVTTRFGYTIEGTANHPILVRTKEGKEVWRKLGELQRNDYIIINRNINLWGKKTRISLKILQEIKSYQYNNKVTNYPLPFILDKDLAYIIGLLIGDGTLTYKNSIALSNIDEVIIKGFYRIIKDKFNYQVKSKKNKADHLIHSKQIRLFFEKIGMGYENSLNKEIPPSILESPKSLVKGFLQGLFDTDGDVVTKYGNVSLSSSSYRLAQQVQLILLNFGIISSLKEKKTNRNKNYRVQIYGENAILFHNLIGFRLERKAEREKFASKVRMPNYGIPHLKSLLKEVQKRIVQKSNKKTALKKVKKINSIFYTYIPNHRNISYKKLKELIDYCDKNKVYCQELKELYCHNYFYDSIVEIKQSNKEKDVYDFTVPKTHSFTANGLVNHNSTIMRQTALIVLMAQMGSFVPAETVFLGIIDRIFTRVGAYDDLSSGQSTFMVEMHETASILHNATENSLIILDEIGRGTSTFDGVSIAWSVAEFIYNHTKAKTLFATHYHVMNKLAEKFSRIRNYNIAVKEQNGEVIFLHKLIEGGTDQSYGIHVAKLAGLPLQVVERAKEIQAVLEKDDEMIRRIKAKKLEEQKSLDLF